MARYRCTECNEEFEPNRPIPYPKVGPPTVMHCCDSVDINKLLSEVEMDKPVRIGIAELIQ